MLLTERGKKKGKIGNGFTKSADSNQVAVVYLHFSRNKYVMCVCFFFYLLTKQFSTQKWEIGPNSKTTGPIICIASQETINRNSLFVPQYRLFNKLVNFFSLCTVRIFLSLPTGNGNACMSRRVHPYVHCHFS